MTKKRKSFSINQGLKSSLEETISAARDYSGDLNIEPIPISKITLDPDNPRKLLITMDDLTNGFSKDDPSYSEKVLEKKGLGFLANTIKDQGLINPILVYKHDGKYKLVAGERRTLASIIAGETTIQAKILDSKPNALKISMLQWIENIHREDLSLWEKLNNIENIINAYLSSKGVVINELTLEVLSNLIGCSIQQASNYKALINSSEELKSEIKNGRIRSIEKAAVISSAEPIHQNQLIEACINNLNLKGLKKLSKDLHKAIDKKTATFSNEKTLLPAIESRGRQATKVNFGKTDNVMVAKTIMESIFLRKELEYLKNEIGEVDWEEKKSINQAFKKLIAFMEKDCME